MHDTSHSGIAERELPWLTEKKNDVWTRKNLTEKGIAYKPCILISKSVSHWVMS